MQAQDPAFQGLAEPTPLRLRLRWVLAETLQWAQKELEAPTTLRFCSEPESRLH